MQSAVFETPIGSLLAEADEEALCSLQFTESAVRKNASKLLASLESELKAYFQKQLRFFTVPLKMRGSNFQRQVWAQLTQIPYGQTASYKDLAEKIQSPKACRAVGNANGANPFVILIPCHRVISHDGSLGGYSAGITRKKWLLAHER